MFSLLLYFTLAKQTEGRAVRAGRGSVRQFDIREDQTDRPGPSSECCRYLKLLRDPPQRPPQTLQKQQQASGHHGLRQKTGLMSRPQTAFIHNYSICPFYSCKDSTQTCTQGGSPASIRSKNQTSFHTQTPLVDSEGSSVVGLCKTRRVNQQSERTFGSL